MPALVWKKNPMMPFEFPPGYDARTAMALDQDNRIVIAHPELPPMVLNEETRAFEIKPCIP
jgi:hypothetical protein